MARIEVFTGPDCAYCEAAKALLNEREIAFTERNISDPAMLDEFRTRLPRVRAIPQIFADGTHIGGLEDLCLHLADGRLGR